MIVHTCLTILKTSIMGSMIFKTENNKFSEDFSIHVLSGSEISSCIEDLARLRIQVFREFPYLYDGSEEYERKYLAGYSHSSTGVVAIVKFNDRVIGATTGMALNEAAPEFSKPFQDSDFPYNLSNIFYLGESVVEKNFRGRGFGKIFFDIRESWAKNTIPNLEWTTFCAVLRPNNHPAKPTHYQNLESFWQRLGYEKQDGLIAQFEWKEIGENKESTKPLMYWTKSFHKKPGVRAPD